MTTHKRITRGLMTDGMNVSKVPFKKSNLSQQKQNLAIPHKTITCITEGNRSSRDDSFVNGEDKTADTKLVVSTNEPDKLNAFNNLNSSGSLNHTEPSRNPSGKQGSQSPTERLNDGSSTQSPVQSEGQKKLHSASVPSGDANLTEKIMKDEEILEILRDEGIIDIEQDEEDGQVFLYTPIEKFAGEGLIQCFRKGYNLALAEKSGEKKIDIAIRKLTHYEKILAEKEKERKDLQLQLSSLKQKLLAEVEGRIELNRGDKSWDKLTERQKGIEEGLETLPLAIENMFEVGGEEKNE